MVCDPKCHTGSFDDCLDHGEERTEHCIASIIKLGYASCSYALAGIHDDFTVIPNTVPFAVPSLTTDTLLPPILHSLLPPPMNLQKSYDSWAYAPMLQCQV